MPKYLPIQETEESQRENKENMKMSAEMNYNSDNVKELIKSTYFTQRKELLRRGYTDGASFTGSF